jgi:hypothetical protein
MPAPAASPEDLNDIAGLGLVKRSDRHRVHWRDDGQAYAGDEGNRDKRLHDVCS